MNELIDEYLGYLFSVKNASSKTVESYSHDFALFRTLLQLQGISLDISIKEIRLQHLHQCIASLSCQKYAAASINRFISAVRSFFSYCSRLGYIEKNPAAELKNLKTSQKLPRFLFQNEIDEICNEPLEKPLLWQTRDKAIFEMLYSSGCRVAELVSLRMDSFSADRRSALVMGKGSKERWIFFSKDAVDAILLYEQERETLLLNKEKQHLFLLNKKGKPITTRGVSYIISRYTGVEGTGNHISPHTFRHTFATAMVTNGADIRVVQEMLGHSSVSTTQRYTHITTGHLIDIYNKAHPHGKEKK